MRQLNPAYHIKNKKKDELTKEQQQELFTKLERLRYDKERGIIEENAPEQEGSSSQYAAGTMEGSSSAGVETKDVIGKDATIVATRPAYSEC